MATIDEVRLWAVDGGIGHAVAATGVWGGYVHTICDRLGNYETTTKRPGRICGRCRRRLKETTPRNGSGRRE